jgi:hypothetical protein
MSGIGEVVAALAWAEDVGQRSGLSLCFFDGAWFGGTHEVLKLGEELLDWVQVRAIGWHARTRTLPAQTPAAQRCHVGPDAGLIDEDRAPWVKLVLMGLPACALEAFASRVEALAGLENVIKQR